jgi:dihydrofolate synthase / folylpolyglutamate synthase
MTPRPASLLEALGALQARAPRGMMLGLDRVERALAALGDPHLALSAIHIAGSNGKGSTSAMVESIARSAGLRTGLYTSPHLIHFAERIRFGGDPIADEPFERSLRAVLDRCPPDLTFFESLTAAAFHAFREAAVDVAILEVGLGGRLDATNVVRSPIATAITSISLEHTQFLGDTLAAIAREKAGILKPGAPVVLGPLAPEADQAIAEIAAAVSAGPIRRVDRSGLAIALEGPHQAENAAVAAALADPLAARFPDRDVLAHVAEGLAATRWPGRFERLDLADRGVTVILDGAHNPEGAATLARTFALAAPAGGDPARAALVFGALADKRWPEMLASLAPLAARRYYAEPRGRAPAHPADLAAMFPGAAVADPRLAVERAIAESRPGDVILVAGSLYLVGEVRAALLGVEPDPFIAL